jgi:hypothetical protein
MTFRRAVVYIGGASLLVAWFSSAASLSLRQRPEPAQAPDVSATDDLAQHVEAQARRLKERLAAAPVPPDPLRNPFVFRRAAPSPAVAVRRVSAPPEPAPISMPAEPALELIGIAEQRVSPEIVRTAMITTAGDELLLVSVGDAVLQRYRVAAISSTAAELVDLTTGQVRRLLLQDQ